MIPKTIHYCWFGKKRKPRKVRQCIKSWKKHLPGYEIKEWNEKNFDVETNSYVSEAYRCKRYAFVSDYVRLYALLTDGGIYMDTDVEVLSSLDKFLMEEGILGFESNDAVSTGIMATTKGARWVLDLLNDYKSRHFIKPDGEFDLTTNVQIITAYLQPKGLVQDGSFQKISGIASIYPSDYFCPKDWSTGEINLTERTHTIHHFSGSWLPVNNLPFKQKTKVFLYRKFHKTLRLINIDEQYNTWRNSLRKSRTQK